MSYMHWFSFDLRCESGTYVQCWASYFVKVTSYILLATELFSYSYIYYPKNKVTIIILHIILLCVHSFKLSRVKLPPYHVP